MPLWKLSVDEDGKFAVMRLYFLLGEWACESVSSEGYAWTAIDVAIGTRRHMDGFGQAMQEVSSISGRGSARQFCNGTDL